MSDASSDGFDIDMSVDGGDDDDDADDNSGFDDVVRPFPISKSTIVFINK